MKPPTQASLPFLPRFAPAADMRAHDSRVEHLNEMGGRTHGRERVEERLKDAGLAQAIEAFPHAVPVAEALRQSAPANVLDGEEMKRLEEAAIVFGLPVRAAAGGGAEHHKRVRPIVLIHRHRPCAPASDSVGVLDHV